MASEVIWGGGGPEAVEEERELGEVGGAWKPQGCAAVGTGSVNAAITVGLFH